ncbi:PXA domain-containing protein [Phascolomyces articulosus]|uniref:PXA domain-containing protein n=1 Tax=Phascolomyces articulosus TaxID=60185 RepID=A0AAD5K3D3_9FUNG|nr:PXA domain-containing protein [Phascolomyces articulosus]
MPKVLLEKSHSIFLTVSTIAITVLITAIWPQTLHYLFWAVKLVLGTVLSLVLFNIIVLYIYVKYFVSPSQSNRRKQRQRDFRPFKFAHVSTWPQRQQQRLQDNTIEVPLPIAPESEEISEAFEELISYVLRDFIDYWFAYVAGPMEVSFRKSVDKIIRSAALALKQRIQEADLFGILVNRLVPLVTAHISEFRAAEISLRGKSLERSLTQSDELDLLLASQFRGGKLHSALTTAAMTTKPTEVVHLRQIVERVLPYVLDKKELDSGPVSVIVRELVSCAVLQPVMNMIAEPDFWNQTIDSYLGKAIREQKMVRKLREVLNRHSTDLDEVVEELADGDSRSALPSGKPRRPSLMQMNSLSSMFGDQWEDEVDTGKQRGFGSIKMGRRTFQDFLRMIEEEKNLLELKRVRNDIVTQIRKKRALIHDRDPEEIIDGEKVDDVIVYLNRLSVAKKRVDKRIAVLTGENYDGRKGSRSQFFSSSSSRRKPSESNATQPFGFNLYDILTNTAGLSYFMEFMDRRGDMMKLQFWLIIEGFKNSEMAGARDDSTFLQDVRMVYDMYLSESAPHRLPISAQLSVDLNKAIEAAQRCVDDREEGNVYTLVQEMRQRLYQIQQHIFWQLEKEHFPYFKRSDLYFKYLATTPNSAPDTIPERRSLDEATFFRQQSSSDTFNENINKTNDNNDTPRRQISQTSSSGSTAPSGEKAVLESRPLERTASASLAKKKPWDITEATPKADSDTEVSGPKKKRSEKALNKPPVNRTRGHVRAISETAHTSSGMGRFLNLGKMVGSANEWWHTHDYLQRTKNRPNVDETDTNDDDNKHGIIQSPEDTADELTEEEEEEDHEDESAPRPTRQLVRSNTVEAVEAELQSIIDGHDAVDDPSDSKAGRRKSAPPSPRKKQLPQQQPPFLLYGPQGTKSTMALPVQNDYALPSWTSSGGSNTIGEVAHDRFDDTHSSSSSLSKKTAPLPTSKNDDEDPVVVDKEEETSNVHLAPPGDLMLAVKVEKLSEEMEKLMQQEAIVDALIKKAEAKNKVDELRILKKSKNMFRRELQQIKYQKSQYELQESENVLVPERTKISITSSTIGSDSYGEFALYVIEIQQLGVDGNYGSGWIVARRYSEFFALHQKLKAHHSVVKLLEFPSKWPLLRLQRSFVEARRTNLERYLRRLLEDQDICKSEELRAFLSQQNVYVPGPEHDTGESSEFGFFTSIPHSSKKRKQRQGVVSAASSTAASSELLKQQLQPSSSSSTIGSGLHRSISDNLQQDQRAKTSASSTGFMKHIYKTVAEGIDDLFVGPSMLDLITQRMGEQVMDFIQESDDSNGEQRVEQTEEAAAAAAAAAAAVTSDPEFSDTLKNSPEGITKFTEPLCDLFIEMFELKEKNNWLRRQAVVIILQQILGGTIERKLRETVHFLETEPMIVFYLRKVTDSLWPDGQTLTFKEPRRPEEKQHTKEAANRKLSTWLPDLLGQMVGRQNARRGARRLFSVLQNKRLNQDLAYTLFDEIISALFPEIDTSFSTCKA